MSGLFATLAAAAHGDAEALRARPRGRFEPEAGALPEMEVEQRSASEETDEEQPHRPAPRARAGEPVAREGALTPPPEPLMPRAPVTADPSEGTTDAAKRPDPGSQDFAQPRRLLLQSEPLERDANAAKPTAPLLPLTDGNGIAEPLHTSRDNADASAPARHAPEDRAPAPLLPLVANPHPEPDAAHRPLDPAMHEPALQRGRGQRSLSIGRIEVRPPPPAPPPPTPQASYRATIIPRAQPRQSLDEYRRRGR